MEAFLIIDVVGSPETRAALWAPVLEDALISLHAVPVQVAVASPPRVVRCRDVEVHVADVDGDGTRAGVSFLRTA